MPADYVRISCITADVSSIAGYDDLTSTWTEAILAELHDHNTADLVAIHLQGLTAHDNVSKFIDTITDDLRDSRQMAEFGEHIRMVDEKTTGLAVLYFVRDSSNITHHSDGRRQDGKLGAVEVDRHGSTSPCGYSRQSFTYGNGKEIVLVNLALYSPPAVIDNDGLTALEAADFRKEQFDVIVEGVSTENTSIVYFGAFNTQLDEEALLTDFTNLRRGTIKHVLGEKDGTLASIKVTDSYEEPLITITAHGFDMHEEHNKQFSLAQGRLVMKYDHEMKTLLDGQSLREPRHCFPPTRSFGSVRNGVDTYNRTQCPRWADRVIFTPRAHADFTYDSFSTSGLYYNMVGEGQNVGASKPVALHACIRL